jgi:single-stranded-DNA-specific exonuclease
MNTQSSQNYVDLVAVGMVADVMDLRDFETRHLVVKGVQNIYNPYIKSLIAQDPYHLGDEITPHKIAFYIAPYINAVNRSGSFEEKLLVFEAMLDFKAYEQIPSTKRGHKGEMESRVEQACRSSKNIKNRQTKNRDASLEIIKQVIKDKDLLKNKILLIQLENPVDTNLTGLIANQLMSEYQKPVLLLNKVIKKDEETQQIQISWEGSGRGLARSELTDFKKFLTDSGYFIYAEGHNSAFGAGILNENVEGFISYANTQLANFDFTPRYKVDYIYNLETLNALDLINIADWASLWGEGVEEPLIAIENITLFGKDVWLSNSNYRVLKLNLPFPLEGISLVKFGSSEEEYNNLYSELGCVTINVIGKCEINTWNNQPQIRIEEYEIVKKTAYYF